MTTQTTTAATDEDTQLVAASVAGNRGAFGRIVERYQSLVCALTFSATGSVSRSEDLAQETFLAAWRQLRGLREPAKLRAWLCGIARNVINADRRRQGREPAHRAVPLEESPGLTATEPAPLEQAITAEEMALLWREVGQLPEQYREPFVLYYREHQSVARVAAALEISEDAVMQRLSRGRRLLHERLLAFVETALIRTSPGRPFTLRVDASLALLAIGSQAAGVTTAQGLATAKGAAAKGGWSAGLFALALPFIGLLAAIGVSWKSVQDAPNKAERRFARIWNTVLWSSIGGLLLGLRGIAELGTRGQWELRTILVANIWLWFTYLVILVALLVLHYHRSRSGFALATGGNGATRPAGESTATVVATYVATTGWIIGLAWLMGDGATALLIAVVTTGLAAWNLRRIRTLPDAAAHQLTTVSHAGLCLLLLLIVNLRVDRWLAPLYGVTFDEMRQLLPLGTIHVLSVLLLAWAGVLLAATRSRRAGRC